MLHIGLHFALPLVTAVVFWPKRWKYSWLWMLAGMIIDVDHLLADPIYDASRCSIGFHPLHSIYAVPFYLVGYFLTRYLPDEWRQRGRLVLIGIGLHLMLDASDCVSWADMV